MINKVKKCKYCKNITVVPDDYISGEDVIHVEKCQNINCRALNYALIKPIRLVGNTNNE